MTDATQITFTQTGTGAVARTVQLKLQESISVKDFGAIGNGIANDTSAIQLAISSVATDTTTAVYFPPGIYLVDTLTLNTLTKLRGNDAILKRLSSTTTSIIKIPTYPGLNTGDYCLIEGLKIDGNTNGILNGAIGFDVANHASLRMKDVNVTNCLVGFSFKGTQFAEFIGIKSSSCGIGIYIKSIYNDGGGNSCSFYDAVCYGNQVGVLVNNVNDITTLRPLNAIHFWNLTSNNSAVCAVGVVSNLGNLATEVIIHGSANEQSGTGALSYSYDQVTVKKSIAYVNNASLKFLDSYVAEAVLSPAFIAENNAVITFTNVSGYGNTTGSLVGCDSTSTVNIYGDLSTLGSINRIASINAGLGLSQNSFGLGLPPTTIECNDINNLCTSPQFGEVAFIPPPATTPPGLTAGRISDANYGLCTAVQYSNATQNSQNSNSIQFRLTNIGLANSIVSVAIAVNVCSNVDTQIVAGWAVNKGVQRFTLKANQWLRIFIFVKDLSIPSNQQNQFIVYPEDGAGAMVKFCKIQCVSSNDILAIRSAANKMVAGAYNPNIQAIMSNYQSTVAPSTSNGRKGDIVWNSNPTSGGPVGWVCVTVGSPDTWKGFGLIS